MRDVRGQRAMFVVFLACLGVAVPVWWGLLARSPTVARLFLPDVGLEPSVLALAVPDLLMLAPTSLFAAELLRRRSERARAFLVLLLGALTYSTGCALGWTLLAGAPPWGAVLMASATVTTFLGLRAAL